MGKAALIRLAAISSELRMDRRGDDRHGSDEWHLSRRDPNAEISLFGQEKTGETVRLCWMNLAVRGLAGDVKEANTYYDDIHGAVGTFDLVMANRPSMSTALTTSGSGPTLEGADTRSVVLRTNPHHRRGVCMDENVAFMELSALLTGLYDPLVNDPEARNLNAPIATEYARRLRGTFNEKFSALLGAYTALATENPKPPIDDALLDQLRATQEFKDNDIVAKQIVNVWYFSQFNDEAGTVRDGGFYERGYVWPLIRSHPIGFSTELSGYWAHVPAIQPD